MTDTRPTTCAGSGRGTALADFTTRNGEWLAPCAVCAREVSIAIDGRAVRHDGPRVAS